jgi:hypothetical protein
MYEAKHTDMTKQRRKKRVKKQGEEGGPKKKAWRMLESFRTKNKIRGLGERGGGAGGWWEGKV